MTEYQKDILKKIEEDILDCVDPGTIALLVETYEKVAGTILALEDHDLGDS